MSTQRIEAERHQPDTNGMTLGQIISHQVVRTGLRVTDENIAEYPYMLPLAHEIINDVVRVMATPSGRVRNKFIGSVATRVRDGGELTGPQARGVWNVIIANCTRVRAMLWADPKVRRYHRHPGNPRGFGGTEVTDCRVCGKPLNVNELDRGIGASCWKRVLTN